MEKLLIDKETALKQLRDSVYFYETMARLSQHQPIGPNQYNNVLQKVANAALDYIKALDCHSETKRDWFKMNKNEFGSKRAIQLKIKLEELMADSTRAFLQENKLVAKMYDSEWEVLFQEYLKEIQCQLLE